MGSAGPLVLLLAVVGPASEPVFELTVDLSGRSFAPGDTVWITWNTLADDVVNAVIELSPNSGRRWYQISEGEAIDDLLPTWERYPWVVSDTLWDEFTGETTAIASDSCRLSIYDYPLNYDPIWSDGVFAVEGASSARHRVSPGHGARSAHNRIPTVSVGRGPVDGGVRLCDARGRGLSASFSRTIGLRVVSPNGGEMYAVGQPIPIRFTCDPGEEFEVELRLTTDGGRTWELLNSQNIAMYGDTTFTFVPDVTQVGTNCMVNVCDYSACEEMFDVSNGSFTIGGNASARVSRATADRTHWALLLPGGLRIPLAPGSVDGGTLRMVSMSGRTVLAVPFGAGEQIDLRKAQVPSGVYSAFVCGTGERIGLRAVIP
jgi:hypothetical protein